jgi:hypothetical protein
LRTEISNLGIDARPPDAYNCLIRENAYIVHQIFTKINILKRGIKKMETTMKEKLIQFIHNLTDEECEIIVSHLTKEEGRA